MGPHHESNLASDLIRQTPYFYKKGKKKETPSKPKVNKQYYQH